MVKIIPLFYILISMVETYQAEALPVWLRG